MIHNSMLRSNKRGTYPRRVNSLQRHSKHMIVIHQQKQRLHLVPTVQKVRAVMKFLCFIVLLLTFPSYCVIFLSVWFLYVHFVSPSITSTVFTPVDKQFIHRLCAFAGHLNRSAPAFRLTLITQEDLCGLRSQARAQD